MIDSHDSISALTAQAERAQLRADCGSVDARWYCVRSTYRSEVLAQQELHANGFRAYLPQYVSRKRGHEPKYLPYYPRYLFVAFDANTEQWRRIFSTRGVEHMFMQTPVAPLPIPRGIVEALIARGRLSDGMIDDDAQPPQVDLTGNRIQVINGALTSHRGLVSASTDERVTVLLSLLGRDVTVDLARADVRVV